MTTSYNPVFHKDGTVTYWLDSYGWFHRVHPANVKTKAMKEWRAKDRKKWGAAMLMRGFVKKSGKWVPAHEMKGEQ